MEKTALNMDAYVDMCIQWIKASMSGFIYRVLKGESQQRIALIEKKYSAALGKAIRENPHLTAGLSILGYCVIKKVQYEHAMRNSTIWTHLLNGTRILLVSATMITYNVDFGHIHGKMNILYHTFQDIQTAGKWR